MMPQNFEKALRDAADAKLLIKGEKFAHAIACSHIIRVFRSRRNKAEYPLVLILLLEIIDRAYACRRYDKKAMVNKIYPDFNIHRESELLRLLTHTVKPGPAGALWSNPRIAGRAFVHFKADRVKI